MQNADTRLLIETHVNYLKHCVINNPDPFLGYN